MNLGIRRRRATTRRASLRSHVYDMKTGETSYDSACQSDLRSSFLMSRFVYVYILQSEVNSDRFYVGCASDLKDRLRRHNTGEVLHTAKWKPRRIKTYIAFSDEARAREFEQYLKSASGRAFSRKRL